MSEKTKKNVQTAEEPKLEADKTLATPAQITEQALIAEVLAAFEIPPEKAQFAKKMGINVDKIALYVGTLELRLKNVEKNQGVSYAPVQPQQQTQPLAPPPQAAPRGGAFGGLNLGDIIQLVKGTQQSGTNLEQLAEMLKQARTIADVINPPSRFDTLAQRAMARQWNKLGLLDAKEIESLDKIVGDQHD